MYVKHGIGDFNNIRIHEILVEGSGWEVYEAECLKFNACKNLMLANNNNHTFDIFVVNKLHNYKLEHSASN